MSRRTPFARNLALLVGSISLIAALAFAGPASAHHGHGFGDDPAGTIASFDPGSGKLVIDLAKGGSVSGVVTDQTWIESGDACDRGHARHGRHELHGWCRGSRHFEHGDDHHGWGHGGPRGSTADLVAGATVDDALVLLRDGRAWFAKVDLSG